MLYYCIQGDDHMAKANTSEEIYHKLREEIIFLEIMPGQFISEIECANRFGVSRTPIRDVFKKLESEDLLQIIPQKGTFVSLIDISHLSEIMYLREKLEIAITNDIIDTLDDSHLIKLQLLLIKQKKLFEKESSLAEKSKEFILADNAFHSLIFNLARKDTLWKLISQTTPHYHRFRALHNLKDTEVIDTLFQEHNQIIYYLKNKDKEHLTKLYKKHIYGGLENITEIISSNEALFTT